MIDPEGVARVFPQAPIGGEYEARVLVVDPLLDPASGTFGVRLELPNPEGRLQAGLRCEVTFTPATPE
jgi:membrane fusion protein, multidrug efflux system